MRQPLEPLRITDRVKGRPALRKRAAGLLRAVHRFGRCRAATAAERAFAARWIDGLTALLAEDNRAADAGHAAPPMPVDIYRA